MDLRTYITKPKHIETAKRLTLQTRLSYQPFILTDTLEVGFGWELQNGEFSGLIYWPDCPDEYRSNKSFKRFLTPDDQHIQFSDANQQLRATYDSWIDTICDTVGDVSGTTFADIGCNSGYFSQSFAKRGAKKSVGYDRENFSETFDFMNKLIGTKAKFQYSSYDPWAMKIPGCIQYDVVTNIAVVCHLSDPIHFMSFLGSIARKAIFFWSSIIPVEEELLISYGDSNRYYKQAEFPFCFDYNTKMSTRLVYKCLELMGFTDIREIPPCKEGIREDLYTGHKAILALRPQ